MIRRWASHLQDTVIAERHGRPVLAVKAGAGGQCPGMVHDSSASGNTVFVEPKSVIDLGNRLADLDGRIREEEQRVLAELSAAVAEQVDGLQALMVVLLELDLALSRGRYGQWLGAVPPRLEASEDAPFTLKDLRHPLLVWQERKEQGPAVVPVSWMCPPPCGWWRSPVPTPAAKQSPSRAWVCCTDGPCRPLASLQWDPDAPLVCSGAG